MKRVKVKVEPFAGESTVQRIVESANNATAAGVVPRAEVVRDSMGKVTEVLVNLPDVDAPGLAAAAEAINRNSGVATASAMPLSVSEDYESYAPGPIALSALTLTGPSGGTLAFTSSSNTNVEIVTGAEAITSQSLKLKPEVGKFDDRQYNFLLGTFRADSFFGLSSITEYKFSQNFKLLSPDLDGRTEYHYVMSPAIAMIIASTPGFISWLDLQNTNWHILPYWSATPIDTGIPYQDPISLEMQVSKDRVIVTMNGSVKYDGRPLYPGNDITSFYFNIAGKTDTPGLHPGYRVMDDITVEVLDGTPF